MRPQTASRSTTGSTDWLPVDHHKNPFSVGFGVVATGTIDYTVEHTFDDIQDSTVTPTAFPHPDVDGATASADGHYSHPVRAIRLTVNSVSGGSAVLTAIQAGA
jgi:hypothetical protein